MSERRKTVAQVMRPTAAIEPDAHLAAAAYLIKHLHDEALVVAADTEEPVATITDVDISRAIADGRDVDDTRIAELVTARNVAVQADVTAEVAARLMLSQGVESLRVVDGQRLVGIVELADV